MGASLFIRGASRGISSEFALSGTRVVLFGILGIQVQSAHRNGFHISDRHIGCHENVREQLGRRRRPGDGPRVTRMGMAPRILSLRTGRSRRSAQGEQQRIERSQIEGRN
ncbi:hypothetical protein M427DRAFT_476361 [Gonapodya prolifera JEL478]|uniref:Uncharacterized protein n=1 Tax=Gonapodya prolifera (strain JEL478) TaxID=1344416 RepID=A0A139A1E3_GONPJ|nr:hypothetical protein M427DRAFT_476361 [Gonapodya prolifera JEL478]|eukprot:KXS10607.1 hypothetical protein M427DRAFT_476361 [Gonapodya prolifera JEL478]